MISEFRGPHLDRAAGSLRPALPRTKSVTYVFGLNCYLCPGLFIMWEAIAANRRRSIWLIMLMGAVLVTRGACLGAYYGTAYSGHEPASEQVLFAAAVGAVFALGCGF